MALCCVSKDGRRAPEPSFFSLQPFFFLLHPAFRLSPHDQSSSNALTVKYGSEAEPQHVNYTEEELENLTLAYAITIHKSQGSEYPVVVLPLNASDGDFALRRKLVYTAMTRAQKLLVVVGDEHALRKAQTVVNNRDEGASAQGQKLVGLVLPRRRA